MLSKLKYHISLHTNKMLTRNNPFTTWANVQVYKQIKHFISVGYLTDTVIDEEGEIIINTYSDDRKRCIKILKKIKREKTYEDEKKQFAIRKACDDLMVLFD